MGFSPTGQGLDVWQDRYARDPGEVWYAGCLRLGRTMAAAEPDSKTYGYYEKFTEMIHSGLFMPGGRIWYGAGRPVQAMINCFVIPTEDSMAGWGKTVSDLMQITALGGGVGMNLSAVRGKGFSISRGGESTGAVSLGIACNSVGDVLRGGGGRRIAMMQCLNVDHPDINEFISAKVDRGQLNNANISIVIPPHMKTEQFVRAIQLGGGIPLQFAGRTTGHKNAASLWEDVVQNAWQNGEPGVLNGYLANQQSNIRYKHELISTNPCVTGDTVIATVDGPRTFAELAETEQDVLVHCWDPKTKTPKIRWMRRPHKTGTNVALLEVEFDSGLKVRCTPDHKFYSFRGKKVTAEGLRIGQSIRAWSMSEHRDGHLRVPSWDSERNLCNHQWVSRMMWECFNGDIPEGYVVHHIDEDKTNNDISNLELMSEYAHQSHHYPARLAAGFDGTGANHKVVAVTFVGYEDVYNGCVDDAHTYIILDPDPVAGFQSGIVSANCGEIWLPAYGCCCLGALVLPRFVTQVSYLSGAQSTPEVNWRAFAETIHLAVRFLDNVLTVNDYPLPEIQRMCQGERRIGLGVMGLHSMLLDLGMQYDSPEAFKFVDDLFSFIKDEAYAASTQLAQEKGPFAFYSSELLNSGFAKTLDPSIRKQIKTHGLRNCAMLTIAPTGTTSEVMDVSGGIEPLYAPVHIRRRWKGEVRHEELVISKDYLDHPEIVQGAHDIQPRQHFEMQRIVQAHVDNAVSKTINLPTDFPVHSLSDLWLEYLPSLKGTTFYREGSREKEPLKSVPVDQVQEVSQSFLDAGMPVEMGGNYVLDCASGVCNI